MSHSTVALKSPQNRLVCRMVVFADQYDIDCAKCHVIDSDVAFHAKRALIARDTSIIFFIPHAACESR